MNLKQVFKALVDGKRVKCTTWSENEFIQLNKDGTELIDESGNCTSLETNYLTEEMEIYNPVEKIKKEIKRLQAELKKLKKQK